MTRETVDAVTRWAQHCADHPTVLEASIAHLKLPSGLAELDAHNGLLADALSGIHRMISEVPPK